MTVIPPFLRGIRSRVTRPRLRLPSGAAATAPHRPPGPAVAGYGDGHQQCRLLENRRAPRRHTHRHLPNRRRTRPRQRLSVPADALRLSGRYGGFGGRYPHKTITIRRLKKQQMHNHLSYRKIDVSIAAFYLKPRTSRVNG